MVPAGVMILTAATLFAKNLCRAILWPELTDEQVAKLAKTTVFVITVAALCSAIYSSPTLVSLLLVGYGGVAQFFPGVVLGLYAKRVTMPGVFAGMVIGVVAFVALAVTKHDPIQGLNAGFVALCCNLAVVVTVNEFTPTERNAFNEIPHTGV